MRFLSIFIISISLFIFGSPKIYASNSLAQKQLENSLTQSSYIGNYLAASFAKSIGDEKNSLYFFKKLLIKDNENITIKNEVLNLMVILGDIEDSVILAKDIYKIDKNNQLASLVIFAYEIKKGNFEIANTILSYLPSTPVNEFIMPVLRAWVATGMKNKELANTFLEEMNVPGKANAFMMFHKALIYDIFDLDTTDSIYKRIIENDSLKTIRGIEAYIAFLKRKNRLKEQQATLNNFFPKEDQNILIQHARYVSLNNKNLRLINSPGEGIAEVFYSASKALAESNDLNSAIIFSRLSTFLHPTSFISILLLGEIFENKKNWQESANLFRQIDSNSPLGWSAGIKVAKNLSRLSSTRESIELLISLSKQKPDRIEPYITIGDMYRSEKRWLKSIDNYNLAIKRIDKLTNKDWVLLYSRGIAFERSKQWNKAEKDFLRALELEPSQPLVMNYLAYSWVEQGVNLNKAKSMIEEAVKQRPRDGYIMDSLGWVMYRMGKYDMAVKNLERAVMLQPNDPIINYHLGDAYWRVGRFREARFQWEKALVFEPDDDIVLEIKNRIKFGLNKI